MRQIDADSLKHSMDNYNYSYFGTNYDKILEVIDEEPTVDPAVKHAHWIFRNKYYRYWCSVCGQPMDYEYNYCPNCGCKMDEVTE